MLETLDSEIGNLRDTLMVFLQRAPVCELSLFLSVIFEYLADISWINIIHSNQRMYYVAALGYFFENRHLLPLY